MAYILTFYLIFGFVAFAIGRYGQDITNLFNVKLRYASKITREQFEFYNKIFDERFTYYRNLSSSGKARFIARAHRLMHTKEFFGGDGFDLTEMHAALISGSMTQLSFGLKNYTFENVKRVIIYPRQFYSRRIQHDVKGITTNDGLVALSWEDFEQGYTIDDDSYNLGLHELAHAIKLDAIMDDGAGEDFTDKLKTFIHEGYQEFININHGRESFLREYAGTNTQEFFAVCVENFFEAPERFKEELPEIYQNLCALLNQNPLNNNNDYALKPQLKKMRVNEHFMKSVEEAYKPLNVNLIRFIMFVGFFSAMLLIPVPFSKTVMSFGDLIKISLGAMLIAAVVQYKSLVVERGMIVYEYFLHIVVGYLPLACLFFVWLNFSLAGEKHTEKYKVFGYHRIHTDSYVFEVEENPYVQYEDFLFKADRKDYKAFRALNENKGEVFIEFVLEKGFLGYEIVKSRNLLISFGRNRNKKELSYISK